MKTQSVPSTATAILLVLGSLTHGARAQAASCPVPSFVLTGTFNAGSSPVSVTAGDLNGDGKPDLVLANEFSGNVSVLLGRGDGTFSNRVSYAAGTGPSSIALGEFNADDKPDLAVTDAASTNVIILSGEGDGTFLTPAPYGVGDAAQAVAIGDFNRDGKSDLAVANRASANVSVLLGRGDGTFQDAANYDAGSDPYFLAVGDFNGDGNPDLAVVNSALFGDNPGVSVLLGKGDGTFQQALNQDLGPSPRSVAVGDFNGDGKDDLAVAIYGEFIGSQFTNSNVTVLLGKGDGTFQPAVPYTTGEGPLFVASSDVNGDGKPDLVVVNNRSGNVSLLIGRGDGTFDPAVNTDAGFHPNSIAIADFNGDGQPDLAVANEGGVRVLLNSCAPTALDLAVVHTATTFTVSWPADSAGFVLESTPGFNPPDWQVSTEQRATNNNRLEVSVSSEVGERYFRLHKP